MHWEPIKRSLPEPGKKVLLSYKNRAGKGRIVIGHRLERFTEECCCSDCCDCEYNEENDSYCYPAGWYEQTENWDEFACVRMEYEPEYWQPLPKLPLLLGVG